MSWLALTTADLAVLPQVLERVRAMHPDDDGVATIASSLTKVTRQVQSRLPRGTVLDTDRTLIPRETTADAAWLVFEDLLLALSNVISFTDEQKERVRAARKAINEDLPAGRIFISSPANPASPAIMQQTQLPPRLVSRTLTFDRANQEGAA